MSGPAWLAAGFAVLMVMIAVCRACRPAISRLRGKRTELGTDGLHVLMGIAMAGMLQPRLALAPGPVWSGVFAVGAAWFAWQASPRRPSGPDGPAARTRARTPSSAPPWSTCWCPSAPGHLAAANGCRWEA